MIILTKSPIKRTGQLSKLFDMILRGHEQAFGASRPSKQISARYQTCLNKFLWVLKQFSENFRGVWYPSEETSADLINYFCSIRPQRRYSESLQKSRWKSWFKWTGFSSERFMVLMIDLWKVSNFCLFPPITIKKKRTSLLKKTIPVAGLLLGFVSETHMIHLSFILLFS